MKKQEKKEVKLTGRVEVFTRKYFDKNGDVHEVGSVCTITDNEELAHLTKNDALKTVVIEG